MRFFVDMTVRTPTGRRGAILLALLLVAAPVLAQDDQQSRPVLPDIAPRVVEIRGALEISFPSLERQPLIGFNPPPPVKVIPSDRVPFVDAYKQSKADLPPSPLLPPEPPDVSALQRRTPRSGEVEGSFGRYFSRIARARAEGPLGTTGAVYTRLDYRGTEGHEPDYLGLDGVDASFDAVEGLVGVQTTQPGFQLGAELDGFLNDYTIYAADPEDAPEREGQGLGAGLVVRSHGDTPVDGRLRLHYGTTTYETSLPGGDPSLPYQEGRFSVDGRLAVPLGRVTEGRLDAHTSVAQVGPEDADDRSVRFFDGAAGVRVRYSRAFDVTVGLRLLTYAADAQRPAGEAAGRDGTYMAPDVRLNLYPTHQVNVYVENRPGIDRNALADVFRTHPFLTSAPVLQPTVRTLDARGGATFFVGPLEVDLHAGYIRSPNYLFFERATFDEADGYAQGLSATRYGSARILHVGGDASIVLPAGLNVTAGVSVRDGQLLDDEAEIPYFGPVVGRASLSYAFLDNRGLAQLTGTYESARFRDREETRRLGDFFDLDAALFYNVSTSLGLVARVENMSAGYLERWDLYEQPPFVVTAGFRVLW